MSTIVASNLQAAAGAGTVATLASINGGAIAGTRNRIINGGMAIDQRNAGASQTFTAAAANAYSVDRWYGYCTGANVTGQRVQGATVGQFRYQFTGAAGCTGIGFAQRIEQLNSADLAGTTATLSVDLANTSLTSVSLLLYYANAADNFTTKTLIGGSTFIVNSTVTRYSTQVAIPAAATTGIEVLFAIGAQTSGTWTIGDVQLEQGTVATPFERRLNELELCQRYFYTTTAAGDGRFRARSSYFFGSSGVSCDVLLPVKMRVTPTITGDCGSFVPNGGAGGGATIASPQSPESFRYAGGSAQDLTYQFINGTIPTFSAEL